MNINDIIDFVAITIYRYYYIYNNFRINEMNPRMLSFIKDNILKNFYDNNDISETIESIDVLDIPYEQKFMLTDNIDLIKTFTLIDEIIERRMYDDIPIVNSDIILSINTCPFDGLYIKHFQIIDMFEIYLFNTYNI